MEAFEAASVEAPASPPRPRDPGFLEETGDLLAFTLETVRALPRVAVFLSEALRQASILVRGSTLFIAGMTGFIGFSVAAVGYFFLRAAGAADYLGVFAGITTPRASTPIMFGYVFAAKVGCGMAAEIGAMRINEEIDAYEVEGVNPMSYIVGTRLVGALMFMPLATLVALLSNTAGVWLDGSQILQALPSANLLHDLWAVQSLQDQLFAFISLTTTGMVIVIVSCFFGYRAKGGPSGVGVAVAKSLVVNLVLVHLIATFYVILFYGQNVRLPIGG